MICDDDDDGSRKEKNETEKKACFWSPEICSAKES